MKSLFTSYGWLGKMYVPQDDGVAVGRGLGHLLHGRQAGAATLVVDEHRLAQLLGQLVGHGASHDFGRAAGRKGHHEAHRLARPGRLGMADQGQDTGAGGQQMASLQGHRVVSMSL
jgi:hypothetical protein